MIFFYPDVRLISSAGLEIGVFEGLAEEVPRTEKGRKLSRIVFCIKLRGISGFSLENGPKERLTRSETRVHIWKKRGFKSV